MNEQQPTILPPVLPQPATTTVQDTVVGPTRPQGARRTSALLDHTFAQLHRLPTRDTQESWFGGVCAGLATRTGLNVWWLRLALGLSVLVLGSGAGLYLLAWATMPDQHGQVHVEQALRGRGARHKVIATLGLMVALSALVPVAMVLDDIFLPAALLAAVVALVVTRKGTPVHHA